MELFQMQITGKKITKGILESVIKRVGYNNGSIDIIPSRLGLAKLIEGVRSTVDNPQKALSRIIAPIKDDYDFIVIDTPPSPGMMMHMSLYMTDELRIVTDAEAMAFEGVKNLVTEIEHSKDEFDSAVNVGSIFINMVEKNTGVHQMFIDDLKETYSDYVEYIYIVPKSVIFKEVQITKELIFEAKDERKSDFKCTEAIMRDAIALVEKQEKAE
jgi:chromosome partitioning protein